MNSRSLHVLLLLPFVFVLPLCATDLQSHNAAGNGTSDRLSDREKAGLRGPVKSCVTTTTRYFSETPFTSDEVVEYLPDGRLLRRSTRNANGPDWLTVNSYDSAGRLVETVSGPATSPASERQRKVYFYDANGGLAAITRDGLIHSGAVGVRRDEQERRIETQRWPEIPDRPGMAVAAPTWQDSGIPMMVPSGGMLETVYNAKEQPVEARMLDKDGRLAARIVRDYDPLGRPVGDRLIMEDTEAIFPAELYGNMNAEQKKAMGAFLRSQMSASAEYKQESEGRMAERRKRNGILGDEITTIGYNERGDKMLERTIHGPAKDFATEYGMDEAGKMAQLKKAEQPPPTILETRYEYEYDAKGNWTEQKVSNGPAPDGTFKVYENSKRTLNYYY